jgi:hypothetical protein
MTAAAIDASNDAVTSTIWNNKFKNQEVYANGNERQKKE